MKHPLTVLLVRSVIVVVASALVAVVLPACGGGGSTAAGSRYTTVPKVAPDYPGNATGEIRRAHLVAVVPSLPVVRRGGPGGNGYAVISQKPSPGTRVPVGSTVTLRLGVSLNGGGPWTFARRVEVPNVGRALGRDGVPTGSGCGSRRHATRSQSPAASNGGAISKLACRTSGRQGQRDRPHPRLTHRLWSRPLSPLETRCGVSTSGAGRFRCVTVRKGRCCGRAGSPDADQTPGATSSTRRTRAANSQ